MQLRADTCDKSVSLNGFDALLVLALDHLSTFCPISKASSFDGEVILAVTLYLSWVVHRVPKGRWFTLPGGSSL